MPNSKTHPSPDGFCYIHETGANWGPGNCPWCNEDEAFVKSVDQYVGRPIDQETREQMALELSSLPHDAPPPAEVPVEVADPTELLPIDSSDPENPKVNARDLHAFLQVGKDFSTWIKGRIESVSFIEGEDFTVLEGLSSPNLGSSKARQQKTKEYLLTMDMAKELSMLERNARGKEARRYFIRLDLFVIGEPRCLNCGPSRASTVRQPMTEL